MEENKEAVRKSAAWDNVSLVGGAGRKKKKKEEFT